MMKKELGLFLLLAVISAITGAINPAFLSFVNLLNMANLIGLFGVFALGEGLVIITGGIDLSLGSMFALLGVVFIDLLTTYQVPWPFALLLVLTGGLALGGIQGFLITRLKMQPFIVTLCGLLIYRGAARYYTSDSTRGFGYGDEASTLGNVASGNIAGIPNTFIFLIILALILGVLLHRSVYGRWLYAVGKNEEAARFSGINTNIVIATAYVISGGLAGVSTVMFRLLHQLGLSEFLRQFLRTLCDSRCGPRRLQPARRRGLDSRYRAGHSAAPGAAEPREHPRHSELPELRGDGDRDFDRRSGGSAIAGPPAAQGGAGRPRPHGASSKGNHNFAKRICARRDGVADERGRSGVTRLRRISTGNIATATRVEDKGKSSMRKTDQASEAHVHVGAAGRAWPGRWQTLTTVLKGFGARGFSISS
ncbi:ribose/xylose/arabinose/galactoside ABC-type transport system permease subunit [Bradyrhizobium sp. JR3.5]